MYLCVRDIEFASFYDFSIGFWNCSDSVIGFCVFRFIIIGCEEKPMIMYRLVALTSHPELLGERREEFRMAYI